MMGCTCGSKALQKEEQGWAAASCRRSKAGLRTAEGARLGPGSLPHARLLHMLNQVGIAELPGLRVHLRALTLGVNLNPHHASLGDVSI